MSDTLMQSRSRWIAAAIALLSLLLWLPIAGALAQFEESMLELQIGPFTAIGRFVQTETTIEGEGTIQAPWKEEVTVAVKLDARSREGTWRASFGHPLLGDIDVANGSITTRGLGFEQRVTVGPAKALFAFVLTPEALVGSGEGTLKLGKISFGRVRLDFNNGVIAAVSEADVRVPGLSAPARLDLLFEGINFVGARGTGKVVLGSYAFAAEIEIDADGAVALTSTQAQQLPAIGAVELTLAYTNGRVSATGRSDISLGGVLFSDVEVSVDRNGRISLTHQGEVNVPGIGATTMTLAYTNGKLSAAGTRQVMLGDFAFDNTAVAIDSAGRISVSKKAGLNLPVIGATQMSLNYDNGVLSASATRTVKLGTFSFSNTAILMNSSGAVSATRQASFNLPGIGSTQMTLSYAGGQLSATGSRDISLGSLGFGSTQIVLDSAGTVALSKQANLNLPGIGSTQMSLIYADGQLSAVGSSEVSMGDFAFGSTQIAISSTGAISVSKETSINLPGVGATQMTLSYANGTLSASGSRAVSLGDYGFGNTQFTISSNGTVAASKETSINLPGIGATQMTLSYANGTLSASGSRAVSLGDYGFGNTQFTISNNGTVTASKETSVNLPGVGSTAMVFSYANGTLSASGARNVSLGDYAFGSTVFMINSTGVVTASKQQSVNLPHIGSTQMTLSYANGVLSATGTANISLGQYTFSNTQITISSTGGVTGTNQAVFAVAGLASVQFNLLYTGAELSASGTKSLSMGGYVFDNTAIAMSSNGTVSASQQSGFNVPGIGFTNFTLGFANGVLRATGTAAIEVSVLGQTVNFGNAAVEISSNGTVSVSASKRISVMGVSRTVSISYVNGEIDVDY